MTPDKSDVLYGTLGLMVIKTLEALGPLHGYRIARRIEQISGDQLALNQGTLYPALLKLEQMGWISSKWGTSESGRRVKIYALTRAGRKQLQKEEAQWQRAASIVERFLKISENPSDTPAVLLFRLRALVRSRQMDREIDDEIASHLAEATEEYVQQGLSPEEARLGGPAQFRRRHADQGGVSGRPVFMWLEDLARDVRHALRTLRKSPAFTTAAAATLALAIGANTTMFSVLNAVLLRPLPYQSPEQLAMLWTEDPTQNLREGRSALWDVEQWRSQSQSFADMATFDTVSTVLTGADGVEQIVGASISPNLLPLLGVQPVLGRSFSTEEAEQRQRLVLISHRFWQARFGGSPDALGATLVLNGFPSQIIGILPADFQIARFDADVWEPHTTRRSVRGGQTWFVIGRLRPGVTFDQAQAEMSAVARRLNDQLPADRKEPGHQRRPIESLHGRTPVAVGVVDARRRRVLRVPHRRRQRHQPLAGAQHRSRARDGPSRGAWSECRTDRRGSCSPKASCSPPLGIDRHTARLWRHSAHPRLRSWQPAASE